ncbi:glycosyltransferase [Candidatus Omnitrophota bacterium]
MKILLACDRSKGHSHPALVLARYIKEHYPYYRVVFYGLKKQDAEGLREEGFGCFGHDIGRRPIIIEGIFLFFEALILLVRLRPARVLGFGGRNSFFIVLFSSLFVPTFLFEPNATYGRANRVLSFFCRKVFLGLKKPAQAKEVTAGVPLRDEIVGVKLDRRQALQKVGLDHGPMTILVFGGSLGSSFINHVFPQAVALLKERSKDVQVIHVAGQKQSEEVRRAYQQMGIKAAVFDFYPRMGVLYIAADAVIARSGASTLAEICFCAKPALLIPYPYAYRHQSKNAGFLLERAAALSAEQFSLNNQRLRDIVDTLLKDKNRASLSENAKKQKIWSTQEEFSKNILSHM